ncbi:uncharacterized protein LOC116163219, partial [Photinus pyralis]
MGSNMNNEHTTNSAYQGTDEFEKEIPALPQDLKNVLKISGYYNIESLSNITNDDIQAIEQFGREELTSLIDEAEYEQYFGVYKRVPQKFKLLPGHKKLLKIASETLKKKLNEQKNIQKFQNPLSSRQRNCPKTQVREEVIDLHLEKNNLRKELLKKCKDIIQEATLDLNKKSEYLTRLDNIEVTVQIGHNDDLFGTVCCILCQNKVKLFFEQRKSTCAPRWLRGNFYKHFKAHFYTKIPANKSTLVSNEIENETNSQGNCRPNKKFKTMLNYLEKPSENPKIDFLSVSGIEKNSSNTSHVVSHIDCEFNLQSEPKRPKPSSTITSTITNDQTRDQLTNQQACTKKVNVIQNVLLNTKSDDTVKSRVEFENKSEENLKIPDRAANSRSDRIKRKLSVIPQNQPYITTFFPYVNSVEKVMQENAELKRLFLDNCKKINVFENHPNESSDDENIKGLLNLLIKTATANNNNTKKSNKYNLTLKKFSNYLFIIGGRLLYETLYLNLNGALPSISTVQRELFKNCSIEEGVPRIKQLSEHLSKRNFPKTVWLSEDGTRINGRIQYCASTDTNVGFVLPINPNGYPNNMAFKATSIQEVKRQFQEESKANYTYALVAQPLIAKSPQFCYCLYGTDNRFSSSDVLQRWRTTIAMAKDNEIEVLGMSSDGDSRLLKVMKYVTKLSSAQNNDGWPWFHAELNNPEVICVQDTTHIGTKLRTRLIKPGILLPFGDYIVSSDHLKYIIEHFSKDVHRLVLTDINSQDKMNFTAVLKICDAKVLDLLKSAVPNSEATILYLTIVKNVLDAYMQQDIKLDERLYKIWYSVFILRIWRQWIKESDIYTLKDNFITLNSYTCIELNAHAMILLIRKFVSDNNLSPNMFLPHLMSSQPCEQLFRATRSMTSTYSTVVNYSMLEILHRLNRIHYLEDAKHELQGNFNFPKRMRVSTTTETYYEPMTDCDIEAVVLKSQKDAIHTAEKMGIINCDRWTSMMELNKVQIDVDCDEKSNAGNEEDGDRIDDVVQCEVPCDEQSTDTSNNNTLIEAIQENGDDDVDAEDTEVLKQCFGESLDLKDYTEKVDLDTNNLSGGPYLKVVLKNGATKTVKKSSVCWMLNENISRLSADRLYRFKGQTNKKNIVLNKNRKCIKYVTEDEKNSKNQVRKRRSRDNSSSESELEIENIGLHDSEDISDEEPKKISKVNVNILNEHYYAVKYDAAWYIGKVVNAKKEGLVQVKFLKENLQHWPKQEDVQNVEVIQIFYGPIKMLGSKPMSLSWSDR